MVKALVSMSSDPHIVIPMMRDVVRLLSLCAVLSPVSQVGAQHIALGTDLSASDTALADGALVGRRCKA